MIKKDNLYVSSKIILLALIILLSTISVSNSQTLVETYAKQYPFISMDDTVFTFYTEFELPNGYEYPNPVNLNKFQNWIINFPIWHQYKKVGIWDGGIEFEPDEVSRVVHLPWHGHLYRDLNFPLRILGEFLFLNKKQEQFVFYPKKGDSLFYSDWLNGRPMYTARKEVFIEPDIPKKPTEKEFYKYIHFCMQENNYLSLSQNCTEIKENELMPGDLYITWNRNGMRGNVYLILNMIYNNKDEKLFAIATGSPEEACDYYIPKFNDNRNLPWISINKLKELPTEKLNSGFFRFNLINGSD